MDCWYCTRAGGGTRYSGLLKLVLGIRRVYVGPGTFDSATGDEPAGRVEATDAAATAAAADMPSLLSGPIDSLRVKGEIFLLL